MFFVNFFEIIRNFKYRLIENALDAESSMVPFGLFGLVSLPVFYFINFYILPSPIPISYQNSDIILRIICASLCCILALKNYWPNIFRPSLPIVWYGAILMFMPFFATYMTLQNHFSAAWTLNSLSILILTMLLVDWAIYALLLILGVTLGTLTYYLATPQAFLFSINAQPLTVMDVVVTYIVSIIMGIIFSRRKGLSEDAKLQTVKSVGATIAHELRTPLASIESGISGAKMYFPKLLDSYKLARKNKINVPDISSKHFETLLSLLDELEKETRYSNTIIDMLLIKSKRRSFSKTNFSICSINYCINEALRRYPFKERELQLIDRDNREDFNFKGESLLILHVLFNLIKNALYFIEQEGKGTIKIWYEQSLQYNIVHFKDTAKGISDYVMPKLFERFYSYSNNGTGLGLAFCKMVMRSLEGDIKCHSSYGEFTDFILYFPKVRI